MHARFTLVLIVLTVLVAGCATSPSSRVTRDVTIGLALVGEQGEPPNGDPPQEFTVPALVGPSPARLIQVVKPPQPTSYLTPDRIYTFTEPVHLYVQYTLPDGTERSFAAIATSLPNEEPFTLQLKPDGPLLIENGSLYVTGTRPATGNGQGGAIGWGTDYIFESRGDHFYIYLLGGTHVDAFRPADGQPTNEAPDRINEVHRVKRFRWQNGDRDHGDVEQIEGDRAVVYDRLRELAFQAGVPFPPPPNNN